MCSGLSRMAENSWKIYKIREMLARDASVGRMSAINLLRCYEMRFNAMRCDAVRTQQMMMLSAQIIQ